MLPIARFARWLIVVTIVGSATAQEVAPPLPYPPVVPLPVSDVPLFVGPGATTVQLPTFNMFTISTTVLVPDRGGMIVGGVNAGASALHSIGAFGFGGYAGASSLGGGGVSVGAQVIDLKEMDRALLAEAQAKRESAAADVWLTRVERARQSTAGRPTISVVEARRLRDAAPGVQR